jgi:CPA2 family monovalent cation:H+ antiporter-2
LIWLLVLHETGMRKYAARRLGQRFMAIDKASIRKLAKATEEVILLYSPQKKSSSVRRKLLLR